jgi:hypothetical protein
MWIQSHFHFNIAANACHYATNSHSQTYMTLYRWRHDCEIVKGEARGGGRSKTGATRWGAKGCSPTCDEAGGSRFAMPDTEGLSRRKGLAGRGLSLSILVIRHSVYSTLVAGNSAYHSPSFPKGTRPAGLYETLTWRSPGFGVRRLIILPSHLWGHHEVNVIIGEHHCLAFGCSIAKV